MKITNLSVLSLAAILLAGGVSSAQTTLDQRRSELKEFESALSIVQELGYEPSSACVSLVRHQADTCQALKELRAPFRRVTADELRSAFAAVCAQGGSSEELASTLDWLQSSLREEYKQRETLAAKDQVFNVMYSANQAGHVFIEGQCRKAGQ